MEGWIKIHRKMLKWKWYQDSNTKSLFFHLLLMANYEPSTYKNKFVDIGCFITSRSKLAKQTGLTVSQVRTALKHLESSNEIVVTILEFNEKSSEKSSENLAQNLAQNLPKSSVRKKVLQGTHIQVLKYENYQIVPKPLAQNLAQNLATTKNIKNKKKEKLTASPLEEEHFNFNTPQKMTTEQELDVEIFWNSLLSVYKPEGDKALYNTKLVKQQKSIIAGFPPEERSKIITWFVKYKTQLGIVNPWISNFFKTHPTIDAIANYFRSIKDVKETSTKPKYQTRNEIKRNILTRENSTPEDF
jgi:DNA-binding transcriptional MerR regulator